MFAHRGDARFQPAGIRYGAQIELEGENCGARDQQHNQYGDGDFHFVATRKAKSFFLCWHTAT
jgi:hypothetical protein